MRGCIGTWMESQSREPDVDDFEGLDTQSPLCLALGDCFDPEKGLAGEGQRITPTGPERQEARLPKNDRIGGGETRRNRFDIAVLIALTSRRDGPPRGKVLIAVDDHLDNSHAATNR